LLINYYSRAVDYTVTDKAKVLAKVAKSSNDKPDFDVWLKVILIAFLT
jgi:hypothetical protein